MNILVIFTGGTIGSALEDNFISPTQSNNYLLLEKYCQSAGSTNGIRFDTANPYTILSETINGEHMNMLIACIAEHIELDEYDGIIVTHGTDTLQYTSAAMGYLFADTSIPIVFVSSNHILDDQRANGLDNFRAAVDFIRDRTDIDGGVFVAYKNSDGISYIHRATRVLPHLPYSDDVFSIFDMYYGVIDADGHFLPNENDMSDIDDDGDDDIAGAATFPLPRLTATSPVLRLFPYPGNTYPQYIDDNVRAILLDTFHSGTMNTQSPDFIAFSETARNANIPIFITGANNNADYASTENWNELGLYVLPQSSPIAMYMKAWLILSHQENIETNELYSLLCDPVAGDIIR